jgi:cytochrome P450
MLRDSIGFVGDRFERYGDIYYVPNDDSPLFVLRHPDHFRDVLITNASSFSKKHSGLERLSMVLGDGLLTSDGETWKRHRRMVQPAFSRDRLVAYADTMRDEALSACARWHDGQSMDVNRAMMDLTMRVVARTLFHHDVASVTDDVGHAMSVLQNGVASLALPEWIPNPLQRRLDRATARLDEVVTSMVHERRALHASGKDAPNDLLDALVVAVDTEGDGKRLTEREVRDELVTLFLAGHETTAQALSWTWHLLAKHPDVLAKLHAELDEVLGDRAPGYDDLAKLPYTEQVFKEAMRVYPPVYMLARRANDGTRIGDYDVPRGAEVVLWIYHSHHDSRWFPEPHAFRPERFTRESESKLPKLAYVPFGAGARACIGKVFAMIEGQILLATLAQRFRFEATANSTVGMRPRVTLAPSAPIRMTLRARRPAVRSRAVAS